MPSSAYDGLAHRPRDGRATYDEVVRVPALSVGVYALPDGAPDPQSPHTEDEVYVVVRGHARFSTDDGLDTEVRPGSVVFVPPDVPHRFTDPSEDFASVVVFAPAETGSARP